MMQYKLNFAFSIVFIFLIFALSLRIHAYAEIHYTFFGYSLLQRHHPEVIMDAPWRVNAGEPIPVVCIIKDADRYPIVLERIAAKYRLNRENWQSEEIKLEKQPLLIKEHLWYNLSHIKPFEETGNLEIILEAEYSINGKKRKVLIDNLTGLSHTPLNTLIGSSELPSIDGWHCGDPHYHSDMTQDQVEFGAPAELAVVMGKAIGLKWFAVTDHSYDLDIAVGQYFQRDENFTRWSNVQNTASLINSSNDDFIVIPAEELSCGNCKERNIHLLTFGVSDFIPGSGDGVKSGIISKKPDLSLVESLNFIKEKGGFAYAAHPEAGNGFLGAVVLNRGHWKKKDYDLLGYTGLQFWNGENQQKFKRSRKIWIDYLVNGRKLYVLGGNDAHGDFNRCRSVWYPNIKLKETENHIFGKVRTYAHCGENMSIESILGAMKKGNTIVTNGPISILQAQNDNGRIADVGEQISGSKFKLNISSRSTDEFGDIEKIDIYKGDLVTKTEQIDKIYVPEKLRIDSQIVYSDFIYEIEPKNPCYIRLEVTSSSGNKKYSCFTNPIWLNSV
ncbi:MAG: CehA/McbA family metallohydrolase [Candidatus Poribacteria bacterium]